MSSSLICASVSPVRPVRRVRRNAFMIRASAAPNPKVRFAEVLNGRAAMQGFLWGSMDWVLSGENIIQQVEDPVYAIAATGVVTTLALASLITAESFATEEFTVFTPDAELKNGRLAMLGFTTLLGLSAM